MEDNQYNDLVKKIDKLAERVDDLSTDIGRIDRDMADDRKSFSDMNLQLKALRDSDDELRSSITKIQQNTNDSVRKAVRDAIAPMSRRIDEWVELKIVRVRPHKRNLIQWWKEYWSSINKDDWKKEVKKNGK